MRALALLFGGFFVELNHVDKSLSALSRLGEVNNREISSVCLRSDRAICLPSAARVFRQTQVWDVYLYRYAHGIIRGFINSLLLRVLSYTFLQNIVYVRALSRIFMNFGEKITEICKLEEINLREFSRLCDIPYDSIKSYKTGRRTPTWEQIHKISDAFPNYRNFILNPRVTSLSALDNWVERPFGIEREYLEMLRTLIQNDHKEEALDLLNDIDKQMRTDGK